MVFSAKNQRTLKVRKNRNYDEECFFEKKNVFIFKKAFFTEMGRRKIPELAGRLLDFSIARLQNKLNKLRNWISDRRSSSVPMQVSNEWKTVPARPNR